MLAGSDLLDIPSSVLLHLPFEPAGILLCANVELKEKGHLSVYVSVFNILIMQMKLELGVA